MNEFESVLGYKFKDQNLLKTALTHSSYSNEVKNGSVCNERLEFLGDSVLSLITSDYLYKNQPSMSEGELSKFRASLVCESTLCRFAAGIGLGNSLILGKGEHNTGGRDRPSILADAFEAVIAAIYLDGGMKAAGDFVVKFIGPEAAKAKSTQINDFKTALQEIIQQNPEESVSYVLVSESGPDHDKRFFVEVRLNSNCIGKGSGRSKKDAEQQAAKQALNLMGYNR